MVEGFIARIYPVMDVCGDHILQIVEQGFIIRVGRVALVIEFEVDFFGVSGKYNAIIAQVVFEIVLVRVLAFFWPNTKIFQASPQTKTIFRQYPLSLFSSFQ